MTMLLWLIGILFDLLLCWLSFRFVLIPLIDRRVRIALDNHLRVP